MVVVSAAGTSVMASGWRPEAGLLTLAVSCSGDRFCSTTTSRTSTGSVTATSFTFAGDGGDVDGDVTKEEDGDDGAGESVPGECGDFDLLGAGDQRADVSSVASFPGAECVLSSAGASWGTSSFALGSTPDDRDFVAERDVVRNDGGTSATGVEAGDVPAVLVRDRERERALPPDREDPSALLPLSAGTTVAVECVCACEPRRRGALPELCVDAVGVGVFGSRFRVRDSDSPASAFSWSRDGVAQRVNAVGLTGSSGDIVGDAAVGCANMRGSMR
jgi:hypothetical protein